MTLTVSEASRAYREKRKAKLQRLARLEAALREIVAINPADLQPDDGMAVIHGFLMARNIAEAALAGEGEVG